MRNAKIALTVLLTVALIVAGACLPRIVAVVQDRSGVGEASYSNVQSVQLQIQQDIPSIGKLAMIDRMGGTIEISADKTNMSAEQAMDAARAALEPYISAGILGDYSEWNVDLYPLLAQVPDMPQVSGIFWSIVITGDAEDFYLVDLAIDDETGKLLRISFTCEYWDDVPAQDEILDIFSSIYFTELEIPDYQDFATRDLIEAYTGDNTTAVRYRFVNQDYGEVVVDLIVYQHGFYTSFREYAG